MVQRVAIASIKMMVEPGKAATKDEPAVRPKFATIKPGTLLELDGAELADLEAQDAVVAVSDLRAARFGYGPKAATGYVPRVVKPAKDEVSAERLADKIAAPPKGPGPAPKSAPPKVAEPSAEEPSSEGKAPDIDGMKSHKDIDEYVASVGLQIEGFEDMKLADKKEAVQAALAASTESDAI